MKIKILIFSLIISISSYIFSEEFYINQGTPLQGMRGKPINLPDISGVVNISGYFSDDNNDTGKNKLKVDEVETAFQGYIYPELRADIILAVHRHGEEYETEVCEAKSSFLNLGYGFSAEVGKIHLDFGKINKLHTHHLPMTDRPLVLRNFLGEHEFAPTGMVVKYLIPFIPFYSQFQLGFWNISLHHHETKETEVLDINGTTVTVNSLVHSESDFYPTDKIYSFRWNSSFEIADNKDIEFGLSGIKGRGPHYTEHKDNVEIVGADITFRWFPSSYKKWTFQNEWIHLKREIPIGKLNREGFYSFINYRADKYWDFGIRFDYSENAWPGVLYERGVSAIVTRHLTETSYWRFTTKHVNASSKNITEEWFQLSFGLGPHSHELE